VAAAGAAAFLAIEPSRSPQLVPPPAAEAIVFDNDALSVVDTGHVPRLHAAYVRDGRVYAIEDHFIFVSDDGGETFRQLGSLPEPNPGLSARLKDRVARLEPVRQIRRSRGPKSLVVLKSGTILVFYDYVYRSDDGGQTFEPVFAIHHTPFQNGATVDDEDRVYFGEYDTSPRPHPIRVFRGTDDGRTWETAHIFESGEIFHVHGVQYDPYRDRVWIKTGDRDPECHLFYTDDDFRNLRRLGGGTQDWRIVSLVPTETALFWGSDNDRRAAGIFRWSFEENRLEEIETIGKVSYFAGRTSDGSLVVTTTYEPESPFTKAAKPPASTELYVSRRGREWHRIAVLPYAREEFSWGPARAQLVVPAGDDSSPYVFFTPLHTDTGDFELHRYALRWKKQ